jgi:hypothetical protein
MNQVSFEGAIPPYLEPQTFIPGIAAPDASRMATLIRVSQDAGSDLVQNALDAAVSSPQPSATHLIPESALEDLSVWARGPAQALASIAVHAAAGIIGSGMAWRITANERLATISPHIHVISAGAQEYLGESLAFKQRARDHQTDPTDPYTFQMMQNTLFTVLAEYARRTRTPEPEPEPVE